MLSYGFVGRADKFQPIVHGSLSFTANNELTRSGRWHDWLVFLTFSLLFSIKRALSLLRSSFFSNGISPGCVGVPYLRMRTIFFSFTFQVLDYL